MARPSPLPQAAPTAALRDVISENATRLTDIVRIAPHVQASESPTACRCCLQTAVPVPSRRFMPDGRERLRAR
jgi:hypothetical protein